MSETEKKMSVEDFVLTAIVNLRDTSKSRGIHSVFSGFNEAFRSYFGKDPIDATKELARNGVIDTRFAKRGVMLYLPGEGPQDRQQVGKEALDKILGNMNPDSESISTSILKEIQLMATRDFPEDFVDKACEMETYKMPPSVTGIDTKDGSALITSTGKVHLRNPSVAKFVFYASMRAKKEIMIPKNNHRAFSAVTEYEKYCKEISTKIQDLLLEKVENPDLMELIKQNVAKKLKIPG